jgi:hypothetical protein
MKFKKGDVAYMKATGYGLTSFEKYEVECISKGKVKLYDLDTLYDPVTGHGADPSLGLGISLCVTPDDICNAKAYVASNG